MACGAIINANNAGLPPELDDVTLNCRYVYRPPFEMPDIERKFGNLTLTYATQIHACVVEVDPETGEIEVVDYAAVDDCGTRINPQIVEGQVHGATAQAIGAAVWETLRLRRGREPPHGQFLRLPRAARAGHAAAQDRLASSPPSPFTSLGAKGMGEGGGAGIHAVCAAIQDALRSAGRAIVTDSHNPWHRVWELLRDPAASRAGVTVESR